MTKTVLGLFKKAFRSAGEAIDEASAACYKSRQENLSRGEIWTLRHNVFEKEITYAAFKEAIGPIT